DLVFVFTMLALAQLWNALAGWVGLVSVGQRAFVGLGAYALFAGVALAGIDPVIAIPLAGCLAAAVAAVVGPLLFRLEGPYFAIGSWVVAEALRLVCAQFKPLGGGTGMSLSNAALIDMTGTKWGKSLFGVPDAVFIVVDWTAYVLFIVVIGGVRTIEGPIVGVLIFWALVYNLAQYGSLYLPVLGVAGVGSGF